MNGLISIKLPNYRLSSLMITLNRSVTITNKVDLGMEMKLLNDRKQFRKVLELFDKHKNNNIQTFSSLTITQILKACAHVRDIQRGSSIHQLISSRVKDDLYILVSLIHLYMQCGDVARGQSLFDNSTKKTSEMYGAMMKGYVKNNMANKVIDLFNQIQNPSEIVINLLFNSCAQLGTKEALEMTKKVAEEMPKSFYSNSYILTSLLDALMKCGDVAHAQSLFDASTNKVLQMYGAMMKGYVKNNMANKAIDLFHQIRNPDEVNLIVFFNACAHLRTKEALVMTKKVAKEMPPSFYSNPHTISSLLDALTKCGDTSSAEILFSKITKSSTNYAILMNGFNKENDFDKTLNLFHQMEIDGVEANAVNYLFVIKALSRIGDYSLAQSIVKQTSPSIFLNNYIQRALVDMWGKIGYVDQAKAVFEQISQPDLFGSTAMINSYGLNGMGNEAVELYRQMPRDLIDEAANVCVLNACSHAGLVDEARSIFQNIEKKTESIFGAMIDCLSRASFFDEAQSLIDEYERCHSPVVSMYMALLSGARNEKNIHLSQSVHDRMKKLFPEMKDPLMSAAVLLANVYASSGEMDKASDIRIQMHKSGVKKKVGLTWTAPNGELFKFRAHDQSHPHKAEIYAENERISQQLLQYGHQYDSSWITRPLDHDETVASVLCGHSERLAVAWNFVVNPNTKLIQVTKNLRVCGDCHRSTKLIAAIRQCEIIVRDANRIHHFYPNGQCSCNDYF